MNKNSNSFFYLLMPELKKILLTVTQSLINNLVCNISEVHTFFPLKDSANNIINVSLTDHNIDLQNTSLENINVYIYLFTYISLFIFKYYIVCNHFFVSESQIYIFFIAIRMSKTANIVFFSNFLGIRELSTN